MTPSWLRSWRRITVSKTRPIRRVQPRLQVEGLEDRSVPAWIVSNLDDSGPGSLRQAVSDANGTPGPDEVVFQAGLTGTITLTGGSIHILDDVTITGPGADVITVAGSAGNPDRIFDIAILSHPAPGIVGISGLTLRDGRPVDAQGGGAILSHNNNLTLTGLKVANNNYFYPGGGVLQIGGNLTVRNSTFTDNVGSTGGAIAFGPGSQLLIEDSTLSNNASIGAGGAIYLEGGALAIRRSTISSNEADMQTSPLPPILGGGGVYLDATSGPVTIEDSTIAGNTALQGNGGGIFNGGVGTLSASGSTFSGNDAWTGNGGGIYSLSSLLLANDTFGGNTASTAAGGAIYSIPATQRVLAQTGFGASKGTDITPFLSDYIAGFFPSGFTLPGEYQVDTTTAGYGHADWGGVDHTTGAAAFLLVDGSSDASKAILYKDVSVVAGTLYTWHGWVQNLNSTPTNPVVLSFRVNGVEKGTFSPTTAQSWAEFTFTYTPATSGPVRFGLYDNVTETPGNDFGLDDQSLTAQVPALSVTLTNSTFNGNSAATYGGGIYSDGTLTLGNTIVAGNTASTAGPDVFNSNGPINATYSLIGTTAGSGIAGGSGNVLNPASTGLGTLGNNGGPTQTIPLLAGSPAIDAGSNALAVDASSNPLTTDQRGLVRVSNGTVDMGAFEYQATVSETIGTSIAGLGFTVDGTTYTAAQTFTWVSGSQHTISTTSPQAGAAGTQYVFGSWSDGGALTHTITAAGGTVSANFTTQYLLITAASPGAGGTVGPASGFYDAGQVVSVSASPNAGYAFVGWTGTGSGSYTGANPAATITMNGPVTEAAQFQPALVVTTATDTDDGGTLADPLGPDGLLSLREAIQVANLRAGADAIAFAIPGSGVQTIAVGSTGLGALPAITEAVTIDGYTQPGAKPNTLAVGDDAVLKIQLYGQDLTAADGGLRVTGGGTTIRGLALSLFAGAAVVLESDGNTVAGNFVGTDASGILTAGNGHGVVVTSANNVIGGAAPADRNVISKNGTGVLFSTTGAFGNRLLGNYVGPAPDGVTGLGNDGFGVIIDGSGAAGNDVGGAAPGEGNVISWNGVGTSGGGVLLTGTYGNRVLGNLIGTDATGLVRLGNDGVGVRVTGGGNNVIGGTTAGERNVVADTSGDGIQLVNTSVNSVLGNYVGTDATGYTDVTDPGPGPKTFGNAGNGVAVVGSSDNFIGGLTPGAGNLISGNRDDGVRIISAPLLGILLGTTQSTHNTVQGNFIGTNVTGTAVMGNGRDGVAIFDSSNNWIGSAVAPAFGGRPFGSATGTAGNLISGNAHNGVGVNDAASVGNAIENNLIGTDGQGESGIGNGGAGVGIQNAVGTRVAANTISHNPIGVAVAGSLSVAGSQAMDTQIENNRIGTNKEGTAPLGNVFGVGIGYSSANTLRGNTIAANAITGVAIVRQDANKPTTGNALFGNLVGTNAAGAAGLGNGGGDPVALLDTVNQALAVLGASTALTAADVAALEGGVVVVGASGNTIGGPAPGDANVIAYTNPSPSFAAHSGDGVQVAGGPANRITGNSIYANAGLGIELVAGGNNDQPAPVVTGFASAGGTTTVTGTLDAAPGTAYTLEFFSNPAGSSAQGRTFLGTGTVTTDAAGHTAFSVTLPVAVAADATVTATATDPANNTSPFSTYRPPVAVPKPYAVGSGAGMAGTVRFLDGQGNDLFPPARPFGAAFTGGVRVATGDVTGDGVADVVVASGPGMASTVKVLDGKTGDEVLTLTPFEATFTGGTFVAVGDLNGDGFADPVITPDTGGGPRVMVIDGKTHAVLANFLVFEPDFRGGISAAVGDVNGDGAPDLVVGAGTTGGPRVAVFDGTTVLSDAPVRLVNDFFAFEPDSRMGVHLAVGDFDGDGKADLIAGPGVGGSPRVVMFDGMKLLGPDGPAGAQVASFFAADPGTRGGVHVAAADENGDGTPELLSGSGDGTGGRMGVYLASSVMGPNPTEDWGLDPFGAFTGGVFVG